MKYLKLLSVVFFLVTVSWPSLAQGPTAGSVWQNQRGSYLVIQSVATNGAMSGYYVNNASGYGCQGTPYPASGWALGSAFSFQVIWSNATATCSSVTAWAGFIYNDTLTTKWNLAVNGSTSASQILQGSDVFKRVAMKTNKSLIKK